MRVAALMEGLVIAALVACTLWATWYLLGRMAESAGPVSLAGPVLVQGGKGSVEIGADVLGQDSGRAFSADKRHLRIERDERGFRVSNLSAVRKVALDTPEGHLPDLRQWRLQQGDEVSVGGHLLRVIRLEPREIEVEQSSASPDASAEPRRAVWRIEPVWWPPGQSRGRLSLTDPQGGAGGTLPPADKSRRRPAVLLGGYGTGATRWPLEDVPAATLRLTWTGDGFALSPEAPEPVLLRHKKENSWTTFYRQLVPLHSPGISPPGERRLLVVGRTVYAVTVDEDGRLVLTPTARRHAFKEGEDASGKEVKLSALARTAGQACDAGSARNVDRACGLIAGRNAAGDEARWFVGGGAERRNALLAAIEDRRQAMLAVLVGVAAALALPLAAALTAAARTRPPSPAGIPLGRPSGQWTRLKRAWRSAAGRVTPRPRLPLLALLAATVGLLVLIDGQIRQGESADRLVLARLTLVALGLASAGLAISGRLRGHTGRLWLLALALGCAGLLTQAQIAFGANSTRWLERVDSHVLGLARIAAAVTLLAAVRTDQLLSWAASLVRRSGPVWGVLRFAVPLLAMLLIAYEFLFGGIVAAEAAKIGLVLTLAIVVTRAHLALRGPAPERALRAELPLVGAALGLAAVFLFFPFYQSDFSPILIMLLASAFQLVVAGWLQLAQAAPGADAAEKVAGDAARRGRYRGARPTSGLVAFGLGLFLLAIPLTGSPVTLALVAAGTGLAVAGLLAASSAVSLLRLRLPRVLRPRRPTRDRALARLALSLGLAVVLGFGVLFQWARTHPDRLGDFSPKLADRFRVWAKPHLDPDAAHQLLSGFEQIRSAPEGVGQIRLGANPPALQLLARVEDDLVGAFVIARFGALAAQVLIALQLLLAAQAAAAGLATWRTRLGDGADRAAGQCLTLAALGVTALWLLQSSLSWANALGLLPLMGQSMTWIAYGQSHLLAVGGGGLTIVLVAAFAADRDPVDHLRPWRTGLPAWLPASRARRHRLISDSALG